MNAWQRSETSLTFYHREKCTCEDEGWVLKQLMNKGRYQILKAWRDGKFQLVISHQILDEYQRVGKTLEGQFPGVDFGVTEIIEYFFYMINCLLYIRSLERG